VRRTMSATVGASLRAGITASIDRCEAALAGTRVPEVVVKLLSGQGESASMRGGAAGCRFGRLPVRPGAGLALGVKSPGPLYPPGKQALAPRSEQPAFPAFPSPVGRGWPEGPGEGRGSPRVSVWETSFCVRVRFCSRLPFIDIEARHERVNLGPEAPAWQLKNRVQVVDAARNLD
jgi:hypothetical protein